MDGSAEPSGGIYRKRRWHTPHIRQGAPRAQSHSASVQDGMEPGEPYNLKCPKKGSELSVTGCVATAMAQVMKYHNWPDQAGQEGCVLPVEERRQDSQHESEKQTRLGQDAGPVHRRILRG